AAAAGPLSRRALPQRARTRDARHRRIHVRAARAQRAGDRDPRGLPPHDARPAATARDRTAHAARRLGALGAARAPRLMAARRALLAFVTALVALSLLELVLFAAERASGRVSALLHGGSRALPDARLGWRPNPVLPDHDSAGWRNAERPAQV